MDIETKGTNNYVFTGNPLEERLTAEGTYRTDVANKLPKLKKLDGEFSILHVSKNLVIFLSKHFNLIRLVIEYIDTQII